VPLPSRSIEDPRNDKIPHDRRENRGWYLFTIAERNSLSRLTITITITIIEITHATALREIRLVPGQIANIISYRIITANCSRLPLPTSLHSATPVAARPPRALSLPPSLPLPLSLSLSLSLFLSLSLSILWPSTSFHALSESALSISFLRINVTDILDAATRCQYQISWHDIFDKRTWT